jgi:FAD/FMN-containing dehydrogenase
MKRRDFLWLTAGATAHWSIAGATALPQSLLDALGANLPATTLDGSATTVPTAHVADLARHLRGRLILPADPDYDQARRVWNAHWDRRPALIARCESPADVIEAVKFAREHRLLTAVRAGGHSATGKSTCDGGIVIDVTRMDSVRVDPAQRRARIESGVLLRDLDRETKAFSLVTTAGTVGHTGAAGLTLGGGLGRVGRHFGLACDNLVAADVVTADGRLVRASETENPDLLWGLRGGGGNFGVVTSLEYALHPMNPMVLGGLLVWPLDRMRAVLDRYAEFVATAPDELNVDLMIVPGGPRAGVNVELCWSGDHAAGERAIAPLRSFAKPVIDTVGPLPYVELQTSADEFLRGGQIHYGKAAFVTTLTPALIDRMVEVMSVSPPPRYALGFQLSGGAIGRVPVDATAFPNRKSVYWMMISEIWTDRAQSEQRVSEVRAAWAKVEPHTEGFYVNAMSEELYKRVQENYGPNYPRLQALKKQYDPGNQFRLNANVTPA